MSPAGLKAVHETRAQVICFVSGGSEHKMLSVRSQASYYKSVFNHVCNRRGNGWQARRLRLNCSVEDEFVYIVN